MRSTRSTYDLDVGPSVDWRLDAACRGYDPEWWTLLGKETAENRMAKKICGGCPVTEQCRELAERTQSWGLIFAGKAYPIPVRRATAQWVVCGYCMTAFTPHVVHARFCSDQCRIYAFKTAEAAKKRARTWTN